jgi:tetratricopeptide (TPR) repeat protein
VTARISRSELAWLAVIVAAVAAIYLPGLGNAPVFDDTYLTDGTLASEYGALAMRARMFSYGTFVWLQGLFGDGLWKQRCLNLALHVGVVVALWALYREILRHIAPSDDESGRAGASAAYERSPALFLAIGFFALNPVAVYAVAYVIQRSILLATFFVVVGLWAFARAVASKRPVFHALALACYALALMSKEHAVLAPLAALPLYIVVARPDRRRLLTLAAAGALLVAAATVPLLALRGTILGTAFDEYSHVYLAQLAKLSPDASRNAYGLSILNQAYLFFEYGLRWFIPYSGWMSINLRPPFPLAWTSFPHVAGVVAYAATLTGGFFLVLRYRDWRALVGLSLLFPALLFATEFATVWVQDPFVLYRSYLWAIGVPGLVFFLLHGLPTRALVGIGAVVGGLLAWQSLDRVYSMRTVESVWSDAIAKLPSDPRSVGRWFPYLNRGSDYVARNEFKLALRDFQASEALGDLGMGAVNMGSILSAVGQDRQALAAFERAEKQGYNLYNLPFQRGLALLKLGRPEEAYRQFEITRKMDVRSPTRELLLLHLGRTALQLGRSEEAVRDLQYLLDIDPRHKEGRFVLGMALVSRGEYLRGHEILDALVREDGSAPAYYGRALARHGLKRKAEALADIEAAIRIGPDNPNLHAWQAKIRAMP